MISRKRFKTRSDFPTPVYSPWLVLWSGTLLFWSNAFLNLFRMSSSYWRVPTPSDQLISETFPWLLLMDFFPHTKLYNDALYLFLLFWPEKSYRSQLWMLLLHKHFFRRKTLIHSPVLFMFQSPTYPLSSFTSPTSKSHLDTSYTLTLNISWAPCVSEYFCLISLPTQTPVCWYKL